MIGLNGTSRLLKALADETRLRILHLLSQEELSGSDLMEILKASLSARGKAAAKEERKAPKKAPASGAAAPAKKASKR